MQNSELWLRDKPLFELMKSPNCLQVAILEMKGESVPEKRQKHHWLAKAQMLKGDYAKAVSILASIEIEYGNHVGPSADLATCYYLMGLPQQFDQTLLKMTAEIDSVLPGLHISNRIRTITSVGKLLEEACQFEKALKLYQTGFSLLEDQLLSPTWLTVFQPLYRRLLAQKIRFYAQYHLIPQMHASLSLLARLKEIQGPLFFSDEIAHSVLLTSFQEDESFSFEKLQQYIIEQAEPLTDFMKNLFFYEWIEYSLLNQKNHTLNKSEFENNKASNLYNQILSDIFLRNEKSCLENLEKVRQKLPLASIIRSFLLVKKSQHLKLTVSQEAYLNSLLKNLSTYDQSVISRWVQGKAEPVAKLILCQHKIHLDSGLLTQTWDLSKKPLILKLLKLFASQKVFHWIEASQALWPESDPSQNYDRLRMLLQRSNNMFKQRRKVFDLRNEQIVCLVQIVEEVA